MKELFIVAPVVALYSPIVFVFWFATNRSPPKNAKPTGPSNPEEMKELFIVAPVVALYSPIVLLPKLVTYRESARVMAGIVENATKAAIATATWTPPQPNLRRSG